MKSIGEKLREARQSQQRSIEDIANRTRINQKHLVEIEHGDSPDLPQTYVRAIIRTYAQVLGLDGEELLRNEIPMTQGEGDSAQINPRESVETEQRFPNMTSMHSKKGISSRGRIVFTALIFIGLLTVIILMRRQENTQPVKEISFIDAIKEQEQKLNAQDSLLGSASEQFRIDSLLLEGIASESVWVRISIDGLTPNEYTFPALYRMRWKAKKSFIVSVGNTAAISFSLNTRKIGALGEGRKPLKDVSLSWETLDKLQRQGGVR